MRLIAASLLAFTLAAGPSALAQEGVVTGPLPKVFELSEHPNLERYWGDEIRAAWAGDCGPALAAARFVPPKYEADRIPREAMTYDLPVLSLHMLDRGLCTAFDPERVTRYLEDLVAHGFSPHLQTDLAWRYWYGFGAVQDRERAKRLFDEGLLGATHAYDNADFGRLSYALNFPLPEYAQLAADHIRVRRQTEESRIAFAVALATGDSSVLPEGHQPVAFPQEAYRLLFREETPESYYRMADLQRRGIIDESLGGGWLSHMRIAAVCAHQEAVLAVAAYYRPKTHDTLIAHDQLARLWYLWDLGLDVEAEIRSVEAKHPELKHSFGRLRDDIERLKSGEGCILK